MSDNPKIQAEIGLNADPAVQGFEKVKKAGKDAAQSLSDSAKKASDSIKATGDSSDESAKKIVQAEGRIEAALKRRIALEEASLKGQRAVDEARISNRGVDPAKYAPYLDQLEKIRQQQDAVRNSMVNSAKSLEYVGLSAKQATAALRQVPAQFTDIVVSLQGGQNPLTVLLQQGGQLKDVFLGVGNAARAIGGYVLGLVNTYTVAAAAIGAVAFAYEKGANEQREFEKTLILTGKAAGVTAGQLSDISARIDQFSGATQGKAAEALNVFANAGIKGASNLERFTATAIEFERAGGGALEIVAENFAKLGKDPLKASLALNDSINFLTRSLYEQIKGLEDQGKATEAAKVAQEAYNSALQDRTPQLVQNLGLIERGWKAITDATKGAYDAALNVGRASNPIDDARAAFSASQVRVERLRQLGPGVDNQRAIAAELARGEASKQILFNLQENEKFERKISGIKAEQAVSVKALAEYDKIKDQYLDKQVQKEREIAKARELARQAGKELDSSVLEGINKKFDEKAKDPTESPAYKEALRAAKLRQELRIKENEEIEKWSQNQVEIQRKTFAKIDEQALKQAAEMFASADKIRAQADAQEDANQAYGKGKSALQELTLAQLEKTKADLQSTDRVIPGVIDAIDLQIEAQRRLIDATRAGEALDYGKKQAEEAAKAFEKMQDDAKRAAESINNSLTDAIMRGFENGKGFAENFFDTLKNMAKTLILRPVISAVVNPVSQGISGLFGGGSAGGGLGSMGSALGSLGSLTGGFGGFTAGFQGATLGAGLAGPTTAGATGLTGLGASLGASSAAPVLSALGTAMPYIAAAVALYSLVKDKKTPHLGSAVNTTLAGTATTDRSDYLAGNYNAETDKALRFLTLGSVGSLNKLDTMFGGAGGFTANAKFAADGKDASAADATIFSGGREVSALGGEGYKLYAPNAEEAFKSFTKDFDGLTLQAIKSLNSVPAYVKAEFDKLGDAATTEGIATLVDQIGVFQGQLSAMKLAIGSLGSVSDEALASIIANAGGIQQFSSAVDSYYQNFYTEAERLAFSTNQVSAEFERLGVSMPSTRKDFRDLVESIDTTSESGQRLYSSLLSLSSSFASVVPAAEEVKTALVETITSVVAEARAAAFTPLTSAYGSYVQDGRTFTTANISDIGRAASGALGSVTSALSDAAGAWASVGGSIRSEIDRIKGTMTAASKESALASFATLTAQARAGDMSAAKLLPGASQTLIDAVVQTAGSSLEIARAKGFAISSLAETNAILGQGPAVSATTAFPVGFTGATYQPVQSQPSTSNAALIDEVKALRAQVALLVASSQASTEVLERAAKAGNGGGALAVEVQ